MVALLPTLRRRISCAAVIATGIGRPGLWWHQAASVSIEKATLYLRRF
jgi:hypothetical protein